MERLYLREREREGVVCQAGERRGRHLAFERRRGIAQRWARMAGPSHHPGISAVGLSSAHPILATSRLLLACVALDTHAPLHQSLAFAPTLTAGVWGAMLGVQQCWAGKRHAVHILTTRWRYVQLALWSEVDWNLLALLIVIQHLYTGTATGVSIYY